MGTSFIGDGTGSGRLARVDTENKLRTSAVTESEFVHASELGSAYGLSSGLLNLTSDSPSAIFYLKNNETRDLIVTFLEYTNQQSVGGTNGAAFQVYRSVTGGTIVSNAVDGAKRNFNFGSSNMITADVYKGSEGDTIVGDPAIGFFIDTTKASGDLVPLQGLIIAPAQTIGIVCTPPTGNTSLTIGVGLRVYMKLEGTSI